MSEPIKPVEIVEVEPETVIVEEHVTVIPPNRPRKVYGGMWGPLEIGAVAAGGLVLLLSLVIYFFWVLPSDRELAKNRSEIERLDAEVASARSKYGEMTDTQSAVEKIVASVDDFEARFLPLPQTGQTALYQRLNGLMAAYNLINTTGPDYSPLETADQNAGQQTDEEKGRSKFRSLYPGVYVSTTVEGSYQNVRRFIREIETGREFIIVSAVELAPSENENRGGPGNPDAPFRQDAGPNAAAPGGFGAPGSLPNQAAPRVRRGKTHGETVSLHIEMAAYFRRPNVAPVQ